MSGQPVMSGQPGISGQLGSSGIQPGLDFGQSSNLTNPIQPGTVNFNPTPAVAATAATAASSPAVGQAPEADFGNQFDLTSQFAGRAQASGVRDLTIGDFFSGSGAIAITGGISGQPTTIPIAGGDRRSKVSDHFSPIPVNRTYFSYHNFGDAVRDVNGNQGDVKRFTFGVERKFLNDNASFEIRIPFVHGLDSTQTETGSQNFGSGTEFGNLSLATKLLLLQTQRSAVSAGVATILPTAGDAEIQDTGGFTALAIENEAVDIIPFLAFHRRPSQNSWMTLTTQLDFNLTGNTFIADPETQFESRGVFNDQNLFSVDFSTGRWIYNDVERGDRFLRGVAAIFELHYTTTINDSDEIDFGNLVVSNPFNRTDTLNSTLGLRMQLRERTFATIAGVFPLRRGEDLPFENELNFNLSRLF